MSKGIITFGKIEIEKCKLHHCKNMILLLDIVLITY